MSHTLVRKSLRTYRFTLVFAGEFDELTDEFADAVWEAGCEDSHIALSHHELRITFDRAAPTYWAAVLSAVAAIERTGLGLELAAIEAD